MKKNQFTCIVQSNQENKTIFYSTLHLILVIFFPLHRCNINNHNVEGLNSSKKSASDCTSLTECNSEDSDRHSDNCAENSAKTPHSHSVIPTPAPRTTLTEKLNSLQNGSIRSVSVDRVKQVRHESLV